MSQKNIEEVILFQIDKTSKTSKQYSQKEFDKANLGITVEQWILLKIIQEAKQLSQKELAVKSLRDPASITRTLDLLEKKQFIIRNPIPDNRRQYNITLTVKGLAFVAEHLKMVKSHRKRSISGFSQKELETLTAMLERIEKNMS